MRKRLFLAPLAVSVAALLGGELSPAEASSQAVGMIPENSSAATENDHFVLGRSIGAEVRFADHESHASHASHSSHSSHSSGSGY